MERQHLHYDKHVVVRRQLCGVRSFFLSLCGYQKQTQVVMFVWQVPYPLKGPTILSFGYCHPYVMTVLLASQVNSYIYKDYFPNPNKKFHKNAVQPCPKITYI